MWSLAPSPSSSPVYHEMKIMTTCPGHHEAPSIQKVCPRPRDQGPNTEDFRKEERSQGSLSDKLGVRCPREGAKQTVGVRVSETLKDDSKLLT